MKQWVAHLTVLTLVVLLLATPLATHAVALEVTTTIPYTTTTTTWVWDCVSTTLPTTTVTTTTLNLTGPDGTNPDYNTTHPTTTTTTDDDLPPTTHPVTVDLLSSANFTENGLISILANPNYGGEWLSADCYTYEDASLTITPTVGGPWDVRVLRYLHITVTANLPFGLTMTDANLGTRLLTADWFADAAGAEPDDGYLSAGKYVGVIDLYDAYSALLGEEATVVDVLQFDVLLPKPGSITVGHIALSPDAVCTKSAPEIQTTTFPKFPTTGTTDTTDTTDTTTTSTTTTTTVVTYTTTSGAPVTSASTAPPTSTTPSGGVTTTQNIPFYQRADANEDGITNMYDALILYEACANGRSETVDYSLHDLNADSVFNMLDCLILYNYLASGTIM